jgi:hypothetical protein
VSFRLGGGPDIDGEPCSASTCQERSRSVRSVLVREVPWSKRGEVRKLGGFGRSRPRVGTTHGRRKWRFGLAAAVLTPVVAACLLIGVMPSPAAVRPSIAAGQSGPDLGLTQATALKARAGRIYTVTLAGNSGQRWLFVRDPYNPNGFCSGRCPFRAGRAVSALVGATVHSRGGACVAHVTLQGPALNERNGNVVERQLGQGLVASGTTFTTVAAPTWFGRVYLGLSPDSSFRCHNARYAVSLTVQRALATGSDDAGDSASAAQYGSGSTTLERDQAICVQKGQALDRYTNSLTAEINADGRRRGLGGTIARLRAEINAANRTYLATPCPPR